METESLAAAAREEGRKRRRGDAILQRDGRGERKSPMVDRIWRATQQNPNKQLMINQGCQPRDRLWINKELSFSSAQENQFRFFG